MARNLADKRLEQFLASAPQASREEIEEFSKLIERYFLGEITPDEFKAQRLMLGTYGIRGTTDNQVIMLRIKIPQGKLSVEQLECLAELAETYSKGSGHVTTRQDMQLYWIPTKELAFVMARLASVGLTSREACGNSVRNVTACPFAGVSSTEAFDVTKHSEAVTRHFLRNPLSQKLPRKFKIAFEGCSSEDHAKTSIHDFGAVAAIKEENGKRTLGFRIYLGGGLGAAPMQAISLEPFTPASELLRTCEAVVRVHGRLGDRKNRATARLKFVVKKLGPDAFRKEVFAEREKLPSYSYPEMDSEETDEKPSAPVDVTTDLKPNGIFKRWMITNVMGQRQRGYSAVTIRLLLGDISSTQMKALANIVRKHCGGTLRTTITQNLVLRWVPDGSLAVVFSELESIGLAETEAEKLHDITSCPGAETCQLGIAASRGLAREIEARLKKAELYGDDIDDIRIRVSGCPNSCGHHHTADIGFFGGARKINEHLAPHFQLLLGGVAVEGKAQFAKPVLKLPAYRIPDALLKILGLYRKDRKSPQESFSEFCARVGIAYWKKPLEEFTTLPPYEESPEAYRDWGAEAEFSLTGMGEGECAT